MGKGRYLKAAEQACSRKARFDSALEAERTSEWRYRAYQCPICHHFHLTSRPGASSTQPERKPSPPSEEKGPKLRDLDWSVLQGPKPKREPAPKPAIPPTVAPAPNPIARCLGPCGKDGRVALDWGGRLVKSARVKEASLRSGIEAGTLVEIDPAGAHPKVMRIVPG